MVESPGGGLHNGGFPQSATRPLGRLASKRRFASILEPGVDPRLARSKESIQMARTRSRAEIRKARKRKARQQRKLKRRRHKAHHNPSHRKHLPDNNLRQRNRPRKKRLPN